MQKLNYEVENIRLPDPDKPSDYMRRLQAIDKVKCYCNVLILMYHFMIVFRLWVSMYLFVTMISLHPSDLLIYCILCIIYKQLRRKYHDGWQLTLSEWEKARITAFVHRPNFGTRAKLRISLNNLRYIPLGVHTKRYYLWGRSLQLCPIKALNRFILVDSVLIFCYHYKFLLLLCW